MTTMIRVEAFGDSTLRNAFLAKSGGGEHLDQGLAESVVVKHLGGDVTLGFHEYVTPAELHVALRDKTPDVVILDMAPEVAGLGARSTDPRQAVADFHDDLVAAVDKIKEESNAHVLVVNVSTFDPTDQTSSLHGLDEEPISMRAHRINLALLKLSNEIGISIIDVDRITAEAGCAGVVPAALTLSAEGSAQVRDETVRVLEDYGFFDERSLIAQVGSRGGRK